MNNRYLWIDLETTGLYNHDNMNGCKIHKILEVALHITNSNFDIIDDGYVGLCNISTSDISLMNDYVLNMHTSNGLIIDCFNSEKTIKDVEDEILAYLDIYDIEDNIILCGNTIHFDKIFIEAQMPRLAKKLSYRVIDVSSLKELSKIYNPEVYTMVYNAKYLPDDIAHRALIDIKASINELKMYVEYFLKMGSTY